MASICSRKPNGIILNQVLISQYLVNIKQSLRIAIISDTAPPTSEGGVGTAHYNLFRALQEKGLDVELFLFFSRSLDSSMPNDVIERKIHRYGPPPRLHKLLLHINKLIFAVLSPGKVAWNTVDILASGLGVRRMNSALKIFGADITIIPDHGAPGLWIYQRKETPLYLIAHHNPKRLSEPLLGNYSAIDANIAVWLEQKAMPKIRKVVCPSHHMKSWFEKTYRFDGEVKVIPNIIVKTDIQEVPVTDLRIGMGLNKDAVVIGIPSAQTPVKGSRLVPQIIGGIAEKTERRIGFFLPGEIDPDLAIALRLLPSNVRVQLPGRLSHSEYLSAFKGCSFGIFPSLRDNYSMALLEAVVCGVPMVAFDSGGNADIIRDGENGILIPNLDVQALVSAAVALALHTETLKELSKKTIRYSDNHFDGTQTVKQYIDFFFSNH